MPPVYIYTRNTKSTIILLQDFNSCEKFYIRWFKHRILIESFDAGPRLKSCIRVLSQQGLLLLGFFTQCTLCFLCSKKCVSSISKETQVDHLIHSSIIYFTSYINFVAINISYCTICHKGTCSESMNFGFMDNHCSSFKNAKEYFSWQNPNQYHTPPAICKLEL